MKKIFVFLFLFISPLLSVAQKTFDCEKARQAQSKDSRPYYNSSYSGNYSAMVKNGCAIMLFMPKNTTNDKNWELIHHGWFFSNVNECMNEVRRLARSRNEVVRDGVFYHETRQSSGSVWFYECYQCNCSGNSAGNSGGGYNTSGGSNNIPETMTGAATNFVNQNSEAYQNVRNTDKGIEHAKENAAKGGNVTGTRLSSEFLNMPKEEEKEIGTIDEKD